MKFLLTLVFLTSVISFLVSLSVSTDIDDEAPLLVAVRDGHDISHINELILNGHNPNIQNSAGWTPLIFAVNHNDEELVRMLLSAGANVNEAENDGWVPMLFAIFRENLALSQLLLEYNANPYIESLQGQSPYSIAMERGYNEILNYIDQWRIRREQIDGLNTLLFEAAMDGHVNAIEEALKQGAEVDVTNVNGYTPLIAASKAGCLDCVKILLTYDADPNRIEADGWSALTFASSNGSMDLVKMLLDAGGDVLHKSKNGTNDMTILYIEMSNNTSFRNRYNSSWCRAYEWI